MNIRKLVLGYYALLFICFGLVGFIWPKGIADLVHLGFNSEMGYLDFVAMYGGLFLGIGLFLLYCLRDNTKTGFVCVLFTMGSMLVARVYMYASVGEADLIQYIYLAGELFTVVLILGLLLSEKEPKEALA